MTAAISDSTRRVYSHAWRVWERWCAGRQIPALPASPAAVCAYLTERAQAGVSVASIDSACSALSYTHRSHGHTDPVAHDAVRLVQRGLRRSLGTAPRRQAPARHGRGPPDRRRYRPGHAQGSPRRGHDPAGLRLRVATFRTGRAHAGRHPRPTRWPAGERVQVQDRPTGPGSTRRRRSRPARDHRPHRRLTAWTAVRGQGPGPLFTSFRHKVLTTEPISGEAFSRMLRARARASGMSTERITGHSLRAGHATTAALAGVPLDRIAAQTRHRRLATLIDLYIRPAQALQVTSSRELGL